MIFLWAILIGLVLGFLFGFFSKRRDPGSLVVSAIVGIVAGVLSGILSRIVSPSPDLEIWIVLAACIILLGLYRLIIGNRKAP